MLRILLFIVAGAAAVFAAIVIRGFRKAGKRHPAEFYPLDFASPYGALRMFENAMARRDIDAMVAAKDFRDEAEVMLRKRGGALDETLVAQTTATLEAAFRAQWQTTEWPDLEGAKSYFSEALSLADNVVFVHHQLILANGGREDAQVRVVRRGAYWRVSHAPI